jgi:hypothetical protein
MGSETSPWVLVGWATQDDVNKMFTSRLADPGVRLAAGDAAKVDPPGQLATSRPRVVNCEALSPLGDCGRRSLCYK